MKTTLVTVTELARHLDDAGWRVFDCRYSLSDAAAGRRAYVKSHVPGAVHADIGEHLSAPHLPGVTGRHPLPNKETWIDQVRSWGLTPDTQVVVYDDAGGAFAARMWWMLRWIGHAAVAVLDGGWQDWLARGPRVTDRIPEAAKRAGADYARRSPLTRLIETGDVDGSQQVLLDAREPKRFRGEWEPLDPVAGHIPGARCSTSSANLDAAGFFKPKAALRRKFEAAIGEPAGGDVVCYCGSGITAAHNVLAMRHAGFDEPLLYAGSWSEWITDPDRSVAIGE
jgi:thiosulfate/3-mercaptopyruvate sulfurtransferase